MQKTTALILAVLMILSLGATPKDSTTVMLTADQVLDAQNIEFAIQQATAYGTRPGTVILDASAGDFVLGGEDKSINIFVSNLTLTSPNGAVIRNCDDGIYFDNFPIHNVTIAGITFHCDVNAYTSNGVDAMWVDQVSNVTIQDNFFDTLAVGINLVNGDNWKITGNKITVGDPFAQVINLVNTSNSKVIKNILLGGTGVALANSNGNQVVNNNMLVPLAGVYFRDAHDNQVVNNKINGIYVENVSPFFALQLDPNTTGNTIVNNSVTCAPEIECTVYFAADADFMETNQVNNNTVR